MKKYQFIHFALIIIFSIGSVNAQHVINVKVNEPKADIQPTMWGIFFEDINLGADGGIYAELVKNRSFEFTKPLMGWTIQQSKKVDPQIAAMNPPVLVI